MGQEVTIGFHEHAQDAPFKLFVLKTTTNRAAPNTEDVHQHPPIKQHSIKDKQVRKLTFPGKDISFRESGVCRGMTDWLIKHCLQTEKSIKNPRDQMLAIGKIFKKGAPREATFLQGIWHHNALLGIKKGKRSLEIPLEWGKEVAKINGKELNLKFKKKIDLKIEREKWVQKKINALPKGVYYLRVPFHATFYKKINSTLGYYSDPNRAMIEIQGDQAQGLLTLCRPYRTLNTPDVIRTLRYEYLRNGKNFNPMRQNRIPAI